MMRGAIALKVDAPLRHPSASPPSDFISGVHSQLSPVRDRSDSGKGVGGEKGIGRVQTKGGRPRSEVREG
jgi:hypothetical protein